MAKNNHMTRKDAEKEQKETFGFVPDFYSALPDVAYSSLWSLQRDLELAETSLDNRTKELVGVAVAAHIKCPYCIYFHTRAAQVFGASEQQIREAIGISGTTVAFSNSLNGARYDEKKFQKEVERALEYVKSHS